MIKRSGWTLMAVSLLLGLGAAWLANNWVQARLHAANAPGEPGTVVVAAAMDIPFGMKIEPRHVRMIELPKDSAPRGHYTAIADVEAKVATQNVLAGEILLQERFAEHVGGSTLSALVKPKMRAVTVRVNDVIGVAGFLLPGNRVDVLATRLEDRRAITRTVLRDINVLAVDQTATTDKDEPVVVRAVTLEMMPEDAEELVKAREEGTIQLTLRNPLEEEPEPVRVAEEPKPQPRRVIHRAPRPDTTVTIIRGTNIDTTKTTS
jgi:pilus assembly protein CpaB